MAQSAPKPAIPSRSDPGYQEVSVPVPRAVTLVTDVARVLFSRDDSQDKVQTLIDKRRARSEKGDQSLTVTIPRNVFTRTLGLVD
ncbi:hypothetical protein [Hymenobacter glacialis]|uniref:Uncharacterized protein n=1 Tax=Hymenobacter glacialis TaxID=1908236 RepID=A0A1G1SX94_9BACT|nr:hypothetical protein [Hymenobacter glacialis]OGX83245.1 hypothetical protein BEN48_17170 [Hymenobacter glacialis]